MLSAGIFNLPIIDDMNRIDEVSRAINKAYNPNCMWAANVTNRILGYLPFWMTKTIYCILFSK